VREKTRLWRRSCLGAGWSPVVGQPPLGLQIQPTENQLGLIPWIWLPSLIFSGYRRHDLYISKGKSLNIASSMQYPPGTGSMHQCGRGKKLAIRTKITRT